MTEEMKTDEESVKVPVSDVGDGEISGGNSGSKEVENGETTYADGPEKELKTVRAELKAEKERFLRMYAEFDNFKKRCTRDMQDFRKYANESLLRDLLPVIDNLERASQSAESTGDAESSVREGIELIRKDMLRLMEKFHVKAVEAIGQPFDPTWHEAIGQEESEEHPDNIVIKEFQKGYLLHDRLIRPSMVVVSKAKVKEAPEETASEEAVPENSEEEVQKENDIAEKNESGENEK